MRHRGRQTGWLWLLVFAAGLAACLTALFRLRLARDLYPPYSTWRADPLGARALHDGLAALPGWRVDRFAEPFEKLAAMPPRTIILAGVDPLWGELPLPATTFNALDSAVRAGSRLVLVFRADFASDTDRVDATEPANKEDAQPSAPPSRDLDRSERGDLSPATVTLEKFWGVTLHRRWLMDRGEGARRIPSAPKDLPRSLAWESDVHLTFATGTGWKTLYTRAGEPVLAECALGRGSIVIATDAYFLSNEALQKAREPALLAWMIGPHARVQFVETHLGIQADPGIAALARRYGLAGAFGVLLLLAALFAWRRMALFVPPVPEAAQLALTYNPTAGLEALLRRALPPAQLLPACLAEWRRTARPADAARAEAASAAATSPIDGYNAVVRSLRRR